jgi:hypothetical protein
MRISGDQDRMGMGRFRNGRDRGDVAGAAEVFIECAMHGFVDDER